MTAPHWQPDGAGSGFRRPRYRSPAAIAAAILLAIAAAGGGSYLALHQSKKDKGGVIPLTLPGCTTSAASAPTLNVPSGDTTVAGGNPFSVQVTKDGKVVFAVTPTTLNVLLKGPGLTLTPSHSYLVTSSGRMTMNGGVLTSDEKYLLVAGGNGAYIFNVADAESGIGPLVGTLIVPGIHHGGGSAVEVVLSPDNRFAFITVKARNVLAVFDLHKALVDGAFGSSAFVGQVPLGIQPVGMALSPDGKWLYVTSYSARDSSATGQGLLSVLDVTKAETDTAASVLAKTAAGCGPARVITSKNGQTVWVTARFSNALLGFSASLLRSAPHHSLVAKIAVGQTPIGLALVNGGTRMIVADTDQSQSPGPTVHNPNPHNLAVVNIAAAKPILLGFIRTGKLPREFAIIPGARYLLVTDNGSGQVQVLDLSKLP